jgi:uncharacterized protein YndB with AHSA1/START domain
MCNHVVTHGGVPTEASVQDSIEREIHIDAPVERVWSLLTEAEHLGSWFADAGAEIDLRPGGELTLRWEDDGTAKGRVERVEEPTAFAFRWGRIGAADETDSTLVEFTLSAADSGTRVHVLESGFASLADGPALYESHSEGWAVELGHLIEHAGRVAT